VVLPILVGLLVLLVTAGVLVVAGRDRTSARRTVEVPSNTLPSSGSPSTSAPAARPGFGSGSTPTSLRRTPVTPVGPATTPLKITDVEGRFSISIPRAWETLAALDGTDTVGWVITQPGADGTPEASGLRFAVRWADSGGRDLAGCGDEVVARFTAANPGVRLDRTATTVNGRPAVRLDAAGSAQELTAWVVVQGDRYWVPQYARPLGTTDQARSQVEAALATFTPT